MDDRPASNRIAQQVSGLLALAHRVALLKAVKRTGWLDRGVKPSQTESVADHTLGVAILAWAAATERRADGARIDPERVLKLALLHDLAEAETGDEPPYDPATIPDRNDAEARRAFLDRRHVRDDARESAKRAAEETAITRLLAVLPKTLRTEFSSIWQELRDETTAEAQLVKQADRLETFLQSRRYHASMPDLAVDSFRREVIATINDPLLSVVRDAVLTGDDSDDRL